MVLHVETTNFFFIERLNVLCPLRRCSRIAKSIFLVTIYIAGWFLGYKFRRYWLIHEIKVLEKIAKRTKLVRSCICEKIMKN